MTIRTYKLIILVDNLAKDILLTIIPYIDSHLPRLSLGSVVTILTTKMYYNMGGYAKLSRALFGLRENARGAWSTVDMIYR